MSEAEGCPGTLVIVDLCAVVLSLLLSRVVCVSSADCDRLNVMSVKVLLSVVLLRRKSTAVEVAVDASVMSSSTVAEGFEGLTAVAVVVVVEVVVVMVVVVETEVVEGEASTVAVAGLLDVSRPSMTSAMLPDDTSADPCCSFLRLSCS